MLRRDVKIKKRVSWRSDGTSSKPAPRDNVRTGRNKIKSSFLAPKSESTPVKKSAEQIEKKRAEKAKRKLKTWRNELVTTCDELSARPYECSKGCKATDDDYDERTICQNHGNPLTKRTVEDKFKFAMLEGVACLVIGLTGLKDRDLWIEPIEPNQDSQEDKYPYKFTSSGSWLLRPVESVSKASASDIRNVKHAIAKEEALARKDKVARDKARAAESKSKVGYIKQKALIGGTTGGAYEMFMNSEGKWVPRKK